MTVAVGVDVIEVDRVAAVLARHPERFLTRHFTRAERDQCGRSAPRLAARWAGKEAASKALGTGIGPVGWHDLEILADASGQPRLVLHDAAAVRAARLGLRQWSISLSHTAGHAVAVVVGATTGE